jgi:hypothetical protein
MKRFRDGMCSQSSDHVLAISGKREGKREGKSRIPLVEGNHLCLFIIVTSTNPCWKSRGAIEESISQRRCRPVPGLVLFWLVSNVRHHNEDDQHSHETETGEPEEKNGAC